MRYFRLLPTFFLIFIIYIQYAAAYYRFFEVTAFNQHERSLLYKLHMENESLVFLNGVTNEAAMPMQVIVGDCCVDSFQKALKEYGVEYSLSDLKPRRGHYLKQDQWIKEPYGNDNKYKQQEDYDNDKSSFLQWKSIISWINQEQKKYPILKKQILALSYEKREIFALSLIKNKNNPIVVLVGGEQGRDWMSVAIILTIIKSFLENKTLLKLLDYFALYFVPIMNPDGYVYSMEKDEFWAKNRKDFFPKKKCDWPKYMDNNIATGVNLERNWYYDKSLTSRQDICNSVYMGHKSLSEEETQGLSTFLNKNAVKLMAFINIIGFGNRLITLPYAHTMQYSNNHGVVMDIIMSACERVLVEHNVTYFNGQSATFLYNFSGNCADWVKFNLNVPIVYTVYLKYKNENIPNYNDIIPLSQQLQTILEETLTISKEIYGPLFSDLNISKKCNLYSFYVMAVLLYLNVV